MNSGARSKAIQQVTSLRAGAKEGDGEHLRSFRKRTGELLGGEKQEQRVWLRICAEVQDVLSLRLGRRENESGAAERREICYLLLFCVYECFL